MNWFTYNRGIGFLMYCFFKTLLNIRCFIEAQFFYYKAEGFMIELEFSKDMQFRHKNRVMKNMHIKDDIL